jgi:polyferredoxin
MSIPKESWKTIKRIRVIVALSFLSLVSLIFLDPWHIIPNRLSIYLTAFEVVPNFIKLFMAGGVAAVIGFSVVTVITFLFGRVYCSTLCPIGTLQDITIHIAKKINRRARFSYHKPPQWLHYLLLFASVVMVIFWGSMFLVDLLEPFSNYGRLMENYALPQLIFINNLVATILAHFDSYFLYGISWRIAEAGTMIFTAVFFLTIIYLSSTRGRLFCNSFCPAGALLSLISRISLFRLVINENSCNECGACDRVCKAQCIDSINKAIDFSACISCFNCLRVCPKNAIEYSVRPVHAILSSNSGKNSKDSAFLRSRREFISGIGIPTVTLLLAPSIVESAGVISAKKRPISPPGSRSLSRFTSICTACQLCVASCPTNVLRPSFLEYGFTGMSQPMMDYTSGYCNYDCVICGEVCPTGAIMKLSTEEKKVVQIGKSKFNRDDCIVVSKNKDCAACSEHCPTKAVHTVPYHGNLLLPEVSDELCIGCGACEHVCPSSPKAIRVEANLIHLTARKPSVESTPKGTETPLNEFPF